jgi:hypothetical protein
MGWTAKCYGLRLEAGPRGERGDGPHSDLLSRLTFFERSEYGSMETTANRTIQNGFSLWSTKLCSCLGLVALRAGYVKNFCH